jgi:GTP-binding protein EngB required for normal cell division
MPNLNVQGAKLDDVNPLRDYVAAKQVIAEVVADAQRQHATLDDQERADACRELLVQLAEDQFNLAVVGQFKRGKSSLMNAIIGRDLLPTGVLPLTSAITTLRYGPLERVLLKFKGWSLEDEIPLSRLPEFVTERGNPGNQKGLLTAKIELPVPFLRRGLNFIDTPGIGSAQSANRQTTYDFLPNADAVLLVTSVEGPLADVELSFLDDIRQYVHKLFIVVNKVDLLTGSERDEVLAFLREALGRRLGAASLQLYPLSARQALAGKLARQPAQVEASGLNILEKDLAAFLTGERQNVFLLSVVERALRLLPQPATDVAPNAAQANRRAGELLLPRQTLQRLQATLSAGALPTATELSAAPDLPDVIPMPAARAAGTRRLPWLTQTTCPVCAATMQAVFDFFVTWQLALARSPEARQQMAGAHGFCGAHTWQLAQIAAPQDLSLGYAPLVEAAGAALRQAQALDVQAQLARLAELLPGHDRCAACAVQRQVEAGKLEEFLGHVATDDGQRAYTQARGLCLPHLALALEAAPQDVAAFLVREQAQRLEATAEDMRNYALKRAALRSGLTNPDEVHGWQRGLIYLVGERYARALDARNERPPNPTN